MNTSLLLFIIKRLNYKTKRFNTQGFSKDILFKPDEKISMKIIVTFIITIYVLRDIIPIFQGLNSENLVHISMDHKFSSLFGFGVLAMISTYAMIALAYKRTTRKTIALLLAILPAIMSSKKAALLVCYQDLVLLFMLSQSSVKQVPFWRLTSGLLLAVLFGITIYLNMISFEWKSVKTIFFTILDMYYGSATSYLNVMWQDMGYALADDYRKEVGSPVVFQYLANPFLKVLGLGGIEYSIGPYLAATLYGIAGELVITGVNPTLFFEIVFISGELIGVPVSIILLTFIYLTLFRLLDLISTGRPISFFNLCIYWEIYKLLISIQFDILNSYKSSLIAIFLLTLMKIILKLKLKFR